MITVNGKQIQLTSEMSVADYLEQNNYQINRIAVEMNEEILSGSRTLWRHPGQKRS